jgi:hypothetical protein
MAIIGIWRFDTATAAPPASGQIRLDQATQPSATRIWVNKTTVTSDDANASLSAVREGERLRLQDEDEPTKWQSYTVSGPPVVATNHFEFPVTWITGQNTLPAQRITLDVLPPAHVQAPVSGLRLSVSMGQVDVRGYVQQPDYAFAFDLPMGYSPGLTKRQYYAGQALVGFIAAAPPASNLIGTVAGYCFRVADSMIQFEIDEAAGKRPPQAGTAGPAGTRL